MATASNFETYGASPDQGSPSWAKGAAAAGLAGGGAILMLRRRRKRRQRLRARELESAAAHRARGALVQSAAAAAPELMKALPDRTKDLTAKAEDLSHSARTGMRTWRKDLGEGKWQAWAAALAGGWLLMRLAERRQTRRLTRAIAGSRA